MRRLSRVHIANELQVQRRLPVDHHRPFNGDVANAQGTRGEACIKLGFNILEEGTCGGEGVVSVCGERP